MIVRVLGQRRFGIARHRDDPVAVALHERNQPQNLVGLTRVGHRQHDVVAGDHTQIAVIGFARMQKKGRRSGTGQRSGYLLTDQARFAHAGHHDLARTGQNRADSALEIVRQQGSQPADRIRLGVNRIDGALSNLTHIFFVFKFGNGKRKATKII